MSGSPTTRSLAEMRSRGYLVAKTEHWNPFAHKTNDLFGFIDMLCVRSNSKNIGVQTTSSDNITARIEKITSLPIRTLAQIWLEAGNRIVVHGWGKRRGRGKRKLWTLDEREIVRDASGALLVVTDLIEPAAGAA